MKLFNHVQIKVQDLQSSRQFYDSIMGSLGFHLVLEIKGSVYGYGTSVHDMFEIRQATKQTLISKSVHLAFNSLRLQCVDDFYSIALANGARCNGKPGYRPEYENGYYAAFVIDLDGHNIEAVYKDSQDGSSNIC